MSIFLQKFCPECTTGHSLSASRCDCGYLFDVDQSADSAHAAEYDAQQERIYLEYLAARASQAEENYRVAKRKSESTPDDASLAAETLLAQQYMNAARAELSTQTVKVQLAAERAHSARATERHAAVAAAKARAATMRPVPGTTKPSSKTGEIAPTPIAAPTPPPAHPAAVPARKVTERTPAPIGTKAVSAPATTATIRTVDAQRIAQATRSPVTKAKLPAKVAASVVESAVATVKPAEKPRAAAVPSAETPPPAVVPSAQATSEFRKAQARKAEATITREPARTTHAQSAPPVAVAKKTAPAAKIPRVAAEDSKDCPNCTASVKLAVMQCRCGFEFSAGVELPGLSLSPTERAALTQALDMFSARRSA